jgi:predicted transcriptional regulator
MKMGNGKHILLKTGLHIMVLFLLMSARLQAMYGSELSEDLAVGHQVSLKHLTSLTAVYLTTWFIM